MGSTAEGKNGGKLFKWSLYLSSYSPLLLMLFLNEYSHIDEEYSVLEKIKTVFILNPLFWILSAGIIIVSSIILGLWLVSMKNEAKSRGKTYNLGALKSGDGDVLSYFITYLIPVLSLRVSSVSSILMNMILVVIVGAYFVSNNTLHFNVVLLLFGYHVYYDNNDNVVITRRSKQEIHNKALRANQIGTSSIFFIA